MSVENKIPYSPQLYLDFPDKKIRNEAVKYAYFLYEQAHELSSVQDIKSVLHLSPEEDSLFTSLMAYRLSQIQKDRRDNQLTSYLASDILQLEVDERTHNYAFQICGDQYLTEPEIEQRFNENGTVDQFRTVAYEVVNITNLFIQRINATNGDQRLRRSLAYKGAMKIQKYLQSQYIHPPEISP